MRVIALVLAACAVFDGDQCQPIQMEQNATSSRHLFQMDYHDRREENMLQKKARRTTPRKSTAKRTGQPPRAPRGEESCQVDQGSASGRRASNGESGSECRSVGGKADQRCSRDDCPRRG